MPKYKVSFEADIELREVGELTPHVMTDLLELNLESNNMTMEDAVQAGRIAKPDVEDALQEMLDLELTLKPVTREMVKEVEDFDD